MPPSRKRKKSDTGETQILALAPPRRRSESATAAKSSTAGLYATAIFLSAFLLFQVQLVMGKFILPRFGGGPSVWSTSLLVFQLLLLAGYGYAAFICAKFDPEWQGRIHLSLLACSAAALALLAFFWRSPILPASSWNPQPVNSPIWQIFVLLITAVGFHCLLLSATSPLLQNWFSGRNNQATPYRLYALSNLGSMLGLLTYPFLIERFLDLRVQAWMWAVGYAVFLSCAAGCAFLQTRGVAIQATPSSHTGQESPPSSLRLLWLALAACASTMLLATTNLICQEVAVIPLLWVLPLSLYLLSFIVCFDQARWYRREIFHPLYLALALWSLEALPGYEGGAVTRLLVIFCLALLAVCMVCHGELARLKPEPQHLTSFYLMVSTGGALGSLFVVLVAPHIFARFWEFQVALLGCGVLLGITLLRSRDSWLYTLRDGWLILTAAAALLAAGAYLFTQQLREEQGDGSLIDVRTRNFFGIKMVAHNDIGMYLVNGHTLHGLQNSNPATRNQPTSYYHRRSGIGLLMDNFPRPAGTAGLRVGVVGLGAGTLAAYGQPGDYFRFYEIDPAVVALSQGNKPLFTFLQSSRAHSDMVLGDARIMMQQEVSRGDLQKFDVLVVDAFSSDAIPVHLLTREAIALYLSQLRGPESVMAFHLSNNTLDLQPVMKALSSDFHLAAVKVHNMDRNEYTGDAESVWVLVSSSPRVLQTPAIAGAGSPLEGRTIRSWTDDYSNLFDLLVAW